MTSAEDAAALLASAPCNTVLPAGAGKTELLALAVAQLAEHRQRTLFLTHTNAGLDAFRRRLHRLGVRSDGVQTWTLSAFCESWCRNYPQLAGLQLGDLNLQDFETFHSSACAVLSAPSIRDVVAASWDIALVDEYQDCQLDQHKAVLALASTVPTIVVGDPLQAVFNFPQQPTVDWNDVDGHFARLELTPVAHRWREINPALGDDLTAIREILECGAALDLRQFPSIAWEEATHYSRVPACKKVADLEGTSVVIAKHRSQCISIAKKADGKLEALEDLASRDLFTALADLEPATATERLARIGQFAEACLARLPSGFKPRLDRVVEGETPQYQASSVLGPFTAAILAARAESTPATMLAVTRAISSFNGIVVARRELWTDFQLVLATARNSPGTTIGEAAELLSSSRRRGRERPIDRVAGTPLLVKGLEYDNALLVDAHQLSREELYVALTRGRRSVSVLSENPSLGPWN
jgi:hypothetical protein